jgi:hypothetical protein
VLYFICRRPVLIHSDLDGFNEWRGGVGRFRPPLKIKFLNEIRHTVFDGKDHLLQILPAHQHHHHGISQDEIRALFVVKEIEQDK